MSHTSGKLGLCIVLHDPRYVGQLINRIRQLENNLHVKLDIVALVPASSLLSVPEVRKLCESQDLQLMDCRKVDDLYFDFSAYREASIHFFAHGYDGVIYFNDTFIPKHNSSYLLTALCSRISMVKNVGFDFPLLVGPYRHSEFSFADTSLDDFVPTFVFYLNGPGLKDFIDLLEEMPDIHRAIEHGGTEMPGINASLLRFCKVHALQLRSRYLINGRIDARQWRKLTTAYCERLLSGRVRSNGLVWYVGGGMFGRILVPMQSGWSALINRLWMKKITAQ